HDHLLSLARAALDAAHELVVLALLNGDVVVRQLTPGASRPALELLPGAGPLQMQCVGHFGASCCARGVGRTTLPGRALLEEHTPCVPAATGVMDWRPLGARDRRNPPEVTLTPVTLSSARRVIARIPDVPRAEKSCPEASASPYKIAGKGRAQRARSAGRAI